MCPSNMSRPRYPPSLTVNLTALVTFFLELVQVSATTVCSSSDQHTYTCSKGSYCCGDTVCCSLVWPVAGSLGAVLLVLLIIIVCCRRTGENSDIKQRMPYATATITGMSMPTPYIYTNEPTCEENIPQLCYSKVDQVCEISTIEPEVQLTHDKVALCL